MKNIDNIISEVRHLNKEDQITLLGKLVAIIQKQDSQGLKLSSISGIGSEIWHGVDINKYIETEREW